MERCVVNMAMVIDRASCVRTVQLSRLRRAGSPSSSVHNKAKGDYLKLDTRKIMEIVLVANREADTDANVVLPHSRGGRRCIISFPGMNSPSLPTSLGPGFDVQQRGGSSLMHEPHREVADSSIKDVISC
jgi:hypothetical protein